MNTEKTEEKYYSIESGPSKAELFDACKYAYSSNAKVGIDFHVAVGYTMPVDHPGCAYIRMKIKDLVIYGIEHEDGSGESFNLRGWCRADLASFGEVAAYTPYRFEAYYNTKTRDGRIRFK